METDQLWRVVPPGGGHLRGPSFAHGRDPVPPRSGGSDSRTRLWKATRIGSPLQRQAELFSTALDVERRVQRGLVGRAFAPFDAVFDLLEESGAVRRGQAEPLEHAAQALEQTAVLMRTQAELFERTIHTLREPSRVIEAMAGVERAR